MVVDASAAGAHAANDGPAQGHSVRGLGGGFHVAKVVHVCVDFVYHCL